MAAGSSGAPGGPGGAHAAWSAGAVAPTALAGSGTSVACPAPAGGAPGAGTAGGDGSGGPAASGSCAGPSFLAGTGSGGMTSPGMNPLLRLEAEWRVLVDYQGPIAVDPERPSHPAGHERLQPQRPAPREENGEPSYDQDRDGGQVDEVQHNELRDNQDDSERDRDTPPQRRAGAVQDRRVVTRVHISRDDPETRVAGGQAEQEGLNPPLVPQHRD